MIIDNKCKICLSRSNLKSIDSSTLLHSFQHFLKYMNYLRVRECKASLDSLFSYFDRVFNVAGDSRSKVEDADSSGHHGYRYAALNVAAMAYRFGHRWLQFDIFKDDNNYYLNLKLFL